MAGDGTDTGVETEPKSEKGLWDSAVNWVAKTPLGEKVANTYAGIKYDDERIQPLIKNLKNLIAKETGKSSQDVEFTDIKQYFSDIDVSSANTLKNAVADLTTEQRTGLASYIKENPDEINFQGKEGLITGFINLSYETHMVLRNSDFTKLDLKDVGSFGFIAKIPQADRNNILEMVINKADVFNIDDATKKLLNGVKDANFSDKTILAVVEISNNLGKLKDPKAKAEDKTAATTAINNALQEIPNGEFPKLVKLLRQNPEKFEVTTQKIDMMVVAYENPLIAASIPTSTDPNAKALDMSKLSPELVSAYGDLLTLQKANTGKETAADLPDFIKNNFSIVVKEWLVPNHDKLPKLAKFIGESGNVDLKFADVVDFMAILPKDKVAAIADLDLKEPTSLIKWYGDLDTSQRNAAYNIVSANADMFGIKPEYLAMMKKSVDLKPQTLSIVSDLMNIDFENFDLSQIPELLKKIRNIDPKDLKTVLPKFVEQIPDEMVEKLGDFLGAKDAAEARQLINEWLADPDNNKIADSALGGIFGILKNALGSFGEFISGIVELIFDKDWSDMLPGFLVDAEMKEKVDEFQNGIKGKVGGLLEDPQVGPLVKALGGGNTDAKVTHDESGVITVTYKTGRPELGNEEDIETVVLEGLRYDKASGEVVSADDAGGDKYLIAAGENGRQTTIKIDGMNLEDLTKVAKLDWSRDGNPLQVTGDGSSITSPTAIEYLPEAEGSGIMGALTSSFLGGNGGKKDEGKGT